MGGVSIVADGGANGMDFVGGNRGSDPTPAKQNSSFSLSQDDAFRKAVGKIRIIIVDIENVRAQIKNGMTLAFQPGNQTCLHNKPAVVGGDGYIQGVLLKVFICSPTSKLLVPSFRQSNRIADKGCWPELKLQSGKGRWQCLHFQHNVPIQWE